MKQQEDESQDKYWTKLVDIERKREFNQITPEEIIQYKFNATIDDKKRETNVYSDH